MKIRQVLIEDVRRAAVSEDAIPDEPYPDHLLIETECTFISAGTELSIFTALADSVRQPGNWTTYPCKAGYANVGKVLAVGPGAESKASVGQRVFTYGKHASHFIYDTVRGLVMPVPEGLSSEEAVASRMAGVAASALAPLDRHTANPVVAVLGLGAVGNFAAQLYQAVGATVAGIDPIPERRALAERCGVRHTLPGGTLEETRQQLAGLDLSGGRLGGYADISVEATGITRLAPLALGLAANGGQVVLVGSPRAAHSDNIQPIFSEIHLRNLVVRGALEWSLPVYPVKPIWDQPHFVMASSSLYDKQAALFRWMLEGRLKVAPLISHRLRPEQAQQGYDGLSNNPMEYTGVLFDWR